MRRFSEWGALLILALLIGGFLVALAAARWLDLRDVVEIHAAMPEAGGWSPESLMCRPASLCIYA